MGETVKISLRCGQKERDLILLGSQYRLSDMVRLAVENYLGITEEQIPLPPMRSARKEAFFTVVLNSETAPEAVELFKKIPEGYRSTAVKLLLRHAMASCDLRALMGNEAKTQKPREKTKPRAKPFTATKRSPPVNRPVSTPIVAKQETVHSDEDGIFDGI